jgi:hypothetical protein
MQIETFEVEQTSSEIAVLAQDAAAVELCEKLGLKGQLTRSESKTLTRNPYRQIQADEAFVYAVLCPERTRPEEYSAEPIPLRVLQVFSHAKELGIYDRFEIWSARHASVKDPVLVGIIKQGGWQDVVYILARWGKELIPVDEMLPAAYKKWHAERMAALLKVKGQVDRAIAEHNETAGLDIIPEVTGSPYVNL